MFAVLRFITEPRLSGYLFAAVLFLVYGLAPLAIYGLFDRNPFMLQLGAMSSISALVVLMAFIMPKFDGLMADHRFRIDVKQTQFQTVVWAGFLLFFVVVLFTAPNVPLFSALSGKFSAEELDLQRGAFLKTREGVAASLGYIGGIFSGTLLPLAMAMQFLNHLRFRYVALAIFIFYSLSYLQKALFVQVVTPLAYLSARRLIWNYFGLVALLIGSVGLLYLNTVLARGVQEQAKIEQLVEKREQLRQAQEAIEQPQAPVRSDAVVVAPVEVTPPSRPPLQHLVPPNFFTSGFRPISTAEHLAWRIMAVPVFTASDALVVFEKKFRNRHIYGATSSLLAALFRLERVNYDAEIYAHQWGATEIGRANSVFITDGYVNFGWIGVIVFSALVGLSFRLLSKSRNEAIRSMWPLFAYNLIQASLIGTLLSAGFGLLFIIAIFIKFTGGASVDQPDGASSQLL